MPDRTIASSNITRKIVRGAEAIRPYANLLTVTIATLSPSICAPLLAGILSLRHALVGLAASIDAATLALQRARTAPRPRQSGPTWITVVVVALVAALATWIIIRWLDRRRAARSSRAAS